MRAESTTLGLVLRATPLRESDLVLLLLTEQHGRISALARGARRSRRRFGGALGFAVLSRLELRPPRGELWTLETAEVQREWASLSADLAAFAHAGYALELAAALAPTELADAHAFELTISMLDHLAARGASAAALRGFELRLLDVAGSAPALTSCAGCGDAPLVAVAFAATRGGALCARCAPSTRGEVRAFDDDARAYLLAAEAGGDGALDEATAPEARRLAREAMVSFIHHTVGHELRSVEFLGKLNAGLRRVDPA